MALTEQALKQFSTEELKKKLGMIQGAMIGLGVMETILIGFAVYLVAGQGMTSMIALVVIPMAMIPIFLMNIRNMKKIKEELTSRGA